MRRGRGELGSAAEKFDCGGLWCPRKKAAIITEKEGIQHLPANKTKPGRGIKVL